MTITATGTTIATGGTSHVGDVAGPITVGTGVTVNVGDLVVIFLGWQSSSNALPVTPAGWTKLGAKYSATQGGLAAYVRQATAGGAQADVYITIPDLVMVGYSGAGKVEKTDPAWSLDAVFSSEDATADASFGVDALTALDVAAGDMILALARENVWDTNPSGRTSQDISATGATIGDETDQGLKVFDNTPTQFLHLVEANCTAGSATGLLHFGYTITVGENPTGFALFIRIREWGGLPLVSHAPIITLISPPPGALGLTEEIIVDVVDPDGDLNRVEPFFTLPTVGHIDLAHDWDGPAFHPAYTLSTRVAITNDDGIGYRYTFRRNTGWVDPIVRLQVLAQDAGIDATVMVVAEGYVTFTRAEGDGHSENAATIPAGWIVQTEDEVPIQFTTNIDAEFAAFQASVTVPVTAVIPGTAGNVGGGDINTIVDPDDLLPDIFLPTVFNEDGTSGGGVESYGGGTTVSSFWEWTTSYSGDYSCGEGGGNPPEIEWISPTPYGDPGTPIADTEHLVFRITDPDDDVEFATALLTVTRAEGDGASENAATIPAGWIFETADGIQFASDADANFAAFEASIEIPVTAVLAGVTGNVDDGTITVIPDTDLGDDILLPTATNADPASGGSGVLGGGLELVLPVLEFPDALTTWGCQVIHNGEEFEPLFAASTRTAILAGFEYDVIWYTGRWPSRPLLRGYVVDQTGLRPAPP